MTDFPCEERCPVHAACAHAGRCLIQHRPCPFCGGEVDPRGWASADLSYGPACSACGATAPSMRTWDSRPGPLPGTQYDRPRGAGFTNAENLCGTPRGVPQHIQHSRELYPSAYEPWSPEADQFLRVVSRSPRMPFEDLCRNLGRSPGAIAARLDRLGLGHRYDRR